MKLPKFNLKLPKLNVKIPQLTKTQWILSIAVILFLLMDITAGVANICGGGLGPTVSGNIEYVSGTKGEKTLRCVGTVRRAGRTFSYIDTEVLGEEDRLLCKGSFIYYNKPY